MGGRREGKILPPKDGLFGIIIDSLIDDGTYLDDAGIRRKIEPGAMALFAVLWRDRIKYGGDFPGMETLMEELHVESKTTLIRYMDQLKRGNYLRVVQTAGKPNDYDLLNGSGVGLEVTTADHGRRAEDRKAKAKGSRPQDPLTKAVTDFWVAYHPKLFQGKPYKFEGEKDWTATQGLIKFFRACASEGSSDEEIMRGIAAAVDQTWRNKKELADPYLGKFVRSIAGFLMVINQLSFSVKIGPATVRQLSVSESDLEMDFWQADDARLEEGFRKAAAKGFGDFFLSIAEARGYREFVDRKKAAS